MKHKWFVRVVFRWLTSTFFMWLTGIIRLFRSWRLITVIKNNVRDTTRIWREVNVLDGKIGLESNFERKRAEGRNHPPASMSQNVRTETERSEINPFMMSHAPLAHSPTRWALRLWEAALFLSSAKRGSCIKAAAPAGDDILHSSWGFSECSTLWSIPRL